MAVYNGKTGSKLERPEVIQKLRNFTEANVKERKKSIILIGENHDDGESRNVQLEILKGLKGHTNLALSLEFYERDVQPVLDEYLDDMINYETFLSDSRPPSNHLEYQPLIDYCRDSKIKVFAANCPRRYSRMVAKVGRDKLEEIASNRNPEFYKVALPPLPYKEASDKYKEKFMEIMGVVGSGKTEEKVSKMLDAQSLWDASMAHTVSKALGKVDTVVHVCGYFHCQNDLGIGEHLPQYLDQSSYRTQTVVVFPEDPEDMSFKPEEHEGLCDYLFLTDISKI